jgi:hypothetical protein
MERPASSDRSPIPPPKYSEGAKSIPTARRIESFKLEIRLPLVGVLQPSATVTAARQLHDFDGLGEAWIARRFDGLMRIHCPPSSTRTWFSAER